MSAANIDLEQGIRMTYHHNRLSNHHRENSVSDVDDEDEDNRSICFSEADEGSCYSTFYSTAGGSYEDIRFTDNDDEIGDGDMSGSRRASSVSECSVEIEIEGHDYEGAVKVHLDDDEVGDEEKECRICHLSLGTGNNVMELGCDCKNDLAVAHSNCAEKWFKIRGNRTCEICNSIAENVSVVPELELMQQSTAITSSPVITIAQVPSSPTEPTRNFWQEQRFLNFLLACMVFAFVLSWLFHFNVPS